MRIVHKNLTLKLKTKKHLPSRTAYEYNVMTNVAGLVKKYLSRICTNSKMLQILLFKV